SLSDEMRGIAGSRRCESPGLVARPRPERPMGHAGSRQPALEARRLAPEFPVDREGAVGLGDEGQRLILNRELDAGAALLVHDSARPAQVIAMAADAGAPVGPPRAGEGAGRNIQIAGSDQRLDPVLAD